MFGINSKKTGKVIALLRNSEGNFSFDQAGIKNRLMTSIYSKKLGVPTVLPVRRRYLKRTVTWGTSLAVAAGLMVTFVVADAAKPGDGLYFLDRLEEELALKFPRSQTKQAEYQAKIVNERLEELDKLEAAAPNPTLDSVKLKASQKAQQDIINAVDQAAKAKAGAGDNKKTQAQLDDVLSKLEKYAGQQEKELEKRRDESGKDDDSDNSRWNDEYEQQLEALKNARLKARTASDRFDDDDRRGRGGSNRNSGD